MGVAPVAASVAAWAAEHGREDGLVADAFLFSETLAAVPEATFVLVVAYCLSTRLVDDLVAVTGATNPEGGSVSVRANVVGHALAKKGTLSLHELRSLIAGLDR